MGRAAPLSSQPMTKFHTLSVQRKDRNQLPHLTSAGEAHMVNVSEKAITTRRAIAIGRVIFGSAETVNLIEQALIQ
jgi:hypothetical protein